MRAAKIAALIALTILALTYAARAGINQYHREHDRTQRSYTPAPGSLASELDKAFRQDSLADEIDKAFQQSP